MAFPTADQLAEFLRGPVARLGLELEKVTATPAGKKSVVEIAVDADRRPGVDELEACSKEISELLDAAEAAGTFRFGAGYTLQVTTPGVDFPLTAARHWRRNRGRLVRITESSGRTLEARIGPLSGDEQQVALVGRGGEARVEDLANIGHAVVQVEFSAAPAAEKRAAEAEFEALAGAAEASEENRKDDK